MDTAIPRSIRRFTTAGLLLLAALVGLAVVPQSGGAQALSVGARGGYTLAGMRWEDPYAADQSEPRSGPHLGLTLHGALSRIWHLEVDAIWVRKGFADGGAHIGSVRVDYLELPLMLSVGIPSTLYPHLALGPTVAFRLRCEVHGVAGSGGGGCGDPLIGFDLGALDVGAALGLGLALPVGPGRWSLDLLADVGLIDIKQDPLPPGWTRNLAIHVSSSFTVPLGARRPTGGEEHRQ